MLIKIPIFLGYYNYIINTNNQRQSKAMLFLMVLLFSLQRECATYILSCDPLQKGKLFCSLHALSFYSHFFVSPSRFVESSSGILLCIYVL